MRKTWLPFVLIVLGAFLFSGVLVWVTGRAECSTVGSVTGRHTEFYLTGGCFVDVDSQLIPLDVWRSLEP